VFCELLNQKRFFDSECIKAFGDWSLPGPAEGGGAYSVFLAFLAGFMGLLHGMEGQGWEGREGTKGKRERRDRLSPFHQFVDLPLTVGVSCGCDVAIGQFLAVILALLDIVVVVSVIITWLCGVGQLSSVIGW